MNAIPTGLATAVPVPPEPSDVEVADTQLDDDRADYVRRLVAARCPELTDEDLALIGGTMIVPREIADLIMDTLDLFEDKIGELEARLGEEPRMSDAVDELERSIDDRIVAAARAIETRSLRNGSAEPEPPSEVALRVTPAIGNEEVEALLSGLLVDAFREARRSFELSRRSGESVQLRDVYISQGARLSKAAAMLSLALDRRRNGGKTTIYVQHIKASQAIGVVNK